MSFKLHGLVVATHSPFHPDGSLAPAVVDCQAAFLAGKSLSSVFITGSTGESHSLRQSEKLALYEAWAVAGPKHALKVIAHVGGNCLGDCRDLAAAAAGHGFAAISAMAPCYFKPGSVEALADWCAAIAAEAPDLPFYFYDIPALSGVHLSMEKFLAIAPGKIPNFAGIKFTNPDLIAYRRCLDAGGGRFDIPWGIDETLVAALATGASGAVGSTYNFMPQVSQGIIAASGRGDTDEARRLQSLSIRVIDSLAAIGYLGAAKLVMDWLGVPVGPARLPLGNPTPAQAETLHGQLAALGII